VDAFNYLSVLLSIILGLGLTQILTAGGRLIRGRAVVVPYWPPLVWACLLVVIYVQVWWSLFGLRHRTEWSFLAFFVVLLQTVVLYMVAALVLPETVAEPSDEAAADAGLRGARASGVGRADLRAHYERQAPWLFGFLAATVAVSIVKEIVLEGRLPERWNLVFHLFLLAGSVVAVAVRRRWYHEALAVVNTVAVVVYITALFSRLR
jgi:hypothetical protein